MTRTTPPDEVRKTDVLGRVRTPKERREALLEEFARSGVSGKKFAALVGVNYQTFASWVQLRRKARGQDPPTAGKSAGPGRGMGTLRLVEAVVESAGKAGEVAPGRAGLVVLLPGGARLEIGDERQMALAARLLQALAGESQPG